jgi:hypothetical protein
MPMISMVWNNSIHSYSLSDAKFVFVTNFSKQFMGTAGGYGINHVAAALRWKKILNVDKRRPWFHHSEEIILHILEAHILNSFLTLSKRKQLSDLTNCPPDKLLHFNPHI